MALGELQSTFSALKRTERHRRNEKIARQLIAYDSGISNLEGQLATGIIMKKGVEYPLTPSQRERRVFELEVLREAKLGLVAPESVNKSLTPRQRVELRRGAIDGASR